MKASMNNFFIFFSSYQFSKEGEIYNWEDYSCFKNVKLNMKASMNNFFIFFS